MRRSAAFLLAALAAAGCQQRVEEPAPAVREPVETRAAVDRAVATTGDVITYRVSVDYDEALEIDLPEPGAEIAGFRIVEVGRDEPQRRQGRVVEGRWYELRADLVGSYVLPPVAVRYREAAVDGGSEAVPWEQAEVVETSAIFVEVQSVLPQDGEAEDIRGLKPLQRLDSPVPWRWLVAGAVALALLAVGGWWLRRRLSRRLEIPPEPAHVVAFRALDALRRTDFDDPAAVRRFYFGISETERAYVEGRFGLNATDLTTEEILARLSELGALAETERDRLARFLVRTDRVKFADYEPSRDDIERDYEDALAFVEATRPTPESESQSDSQSESLEEAA